MKVRERTFWYAHGGLLCLAIWPSCLLIDLDAHDPRVPELFAALEQDQPSSIIIDLLSRGGLTRIPSFGLLVGGEEEARVVVHGAVGAFVDGRPVDRTDAFTEVTAPTGARVALGTEDADVYLPVTNAILYVDSVVWLADRGAMDPMWGVLPADTKQSTAEPTPDEHPVDEHPVDEAPVEEPQSTDATAQAPAVETSPRIEPVVDEAEEVESQGDEPHENPQPNPDAAAFEHLFLTPDLRDAARRAQPQDVEPVGGEDDEDPGRTQVPQTTMSVSQLMDEEPPPAPQPSAPADRQVPAFIDSFDPNPPPGVQISHSARVPAAAPVPQTVAQTAAPLCAPIPETPGFTPDATMINEPVDATIRKSTLTPLMGTDEVIVVAVRCPQGHYGPPYAKHCRVCGAAMDQTQKPMEILRPPLGVLRLWMGGTILLDRGVIFGRNPHLVPGVSGPMSSLVRIDDPNKDVSSQHCEVRLEDWYVSVRDLNSTNGTQVILPHRPPVTLKPNEPMVLESGARVVLASAFDFVFEVV